MRERGRLTKRKTYGQQNIDTDREPHTQIESNRHNLTHPSKGKSTQKPTKTDTASPKNKHHHLFIIRPVPGLAAYHSPADLFN